MKYSSSEFVGWWLHEQKKLKLSWPTVSRIDHDGHYEFSNIRLEEMSENVKERNRRCGNPALAKRRKVGMYSYDDMRLLKKFDSLISAQKETGILSESIGMLCRGKKSNGRPYLKTNSGITFRYLEDG